MSTKRTVVELVAAGAVPATADADLGLDLLLAGFEPGELGLRGSEGAEVGGDEG